MTGRIEKAIDTLRDRGGDLSTEDVIELYEILHAIKTERYYINVLFCALINNIKTKMPDIEYFEGAKDAYRGVLLLAKKLNLPIAEALEQEGTSLEELGASAEEMN